MIKKPMVPRELEEKVKQELESGEQILWMEQPIPRYFTLTSTSLFLFALPWTAFAVFWMCIVSGFHIPDFSKGMFSLFPLLGIPFVLIGLGMLSAPLWTHRKALKTVYTITNRRAITFDAGWTTTIRSYPPEKLKDIYRKDRRSGTGDIILGQHIHVDSEGAHHRTNLGFLNIRNPKTVEQMLRKLAELAPGDTKLVVRIGSQYKGCAKN